MTSPTLPSPEQLPNASPQQLRDVLDTLFESSPALHELFFEDQASEAGSAQPEAGAGLTLRSYDDLIDRVYAKLHVLLSSFSSGSAAPGDSDAHVSPRQQQLEAILGAHPRLGAARGPGQLSAMSKAEQARAGIGGGGGGGGGGGEEGEAGERGQSGEAETGRGVEPGGGGEAKGANDEEKKLAGLNDEYEEKFPGLRYVVFVNGRPRSVIMEDMRARIDRGDIDMERKVIVDAMCDIARDRVSRIQFS